MASDAAARLSEGACATRSQAAARPRRPQWWRRRTDPFGIAGTALAILLWIGLTYLLPASSLPGPLKVASRVGHDFFSAPELSFYGLANASLLGSMIYTTENVLIAMVLGCAIGIPTGLVSARSDLFRAALDPVVMTVGTVPILVAAPFFLIWFGVGRASAVLLVMLYVVIILYLFAQGAAENLDPVFEDAARTLGADDRRIMRDILLPSTVPQILGGIRIALAGAWGLEAIAELLGSQYGIGKIIAVLAGSTDAQGIFAALVVLGVGAVLFDILAGAGIAALTPWNVVAKTGGG